MDSHSPIDDLDAFAYEPGEWRDWSAMDWNQHLLRYCFVRDHTRQPCDPLRATPEDLPLLVQDPQADPAAMVQALQQALHRHASEQQLEPLEQLLRSARRFDPQRRRPPSFFAFLWFTCLIAYGHPDDNSDIGMFRHRFALVFPRSDPAHLAALPAAWRGLSLWLDQDHRFEGHPYRRLKLPAVDPHRPYISHSWHLAFPTLLDRRRLRRLLDTLADRHAPFDPGNLKLVRALLQHNGFSAPFHDRLRALEQDLLHGSQTSLWFRQFLRRELRRHQQPRTQPARPAAQPAAPMAGRPTYGPLVLQAFNGIHGLLLLASPGQPPPPGLLATSDSSWLPGRTLLVPQQPEDPDWAPIEAGFLAIESPTVVLPELEPWLQRGLLAFASDPGLQLPRLLHGPSAQPVSHVLVREQQAAWFQEQVGGTAIELDGDHWLAFRLSEEESRTIWRLLLPRSGASAELPPRLATSGGVPLHDGQGYLAAGLGLPLLSLPAGLTPQRVELTLADGTTLAYAACPGGDADPSRVLWQPGAADRRRPDLAEGPARFAACLADGRVLERAIQLTALPSRLRFRRTQPLAYREDWGLALGPLELPPPPAATVQPSESSLRWARARLNRGDLLVNPLFEQQMLESLSALFQRRASIARLDFRQLYGQLRNKPDEWPGFPDAVLRGWCEGGWLEQGVERGSGRWRIQPVDPRLVRLPDGGLQLVGLLPARGLVTLLAIAHQLGLRERSVLPTCADMPRGWRFHGAVDSLGPACGLPVVDTHDWVPDPSGHLWVLDASLPGDGPLWPHGQRGRRSSDGVCGRRGTGRHWQPQQPFPERIRAPRSLAIEAEISLYGKRRWHSHDPVRETVFTSSHRNRVALHALEVATDGLWPFGFTNQDTGQIDRLYDAEAYLPLPLGRWAALTGERLPGPTRHRPSDHTYRYHVDRALRTHQSRRRFLPLTSLPTA